MENPVSKIFFSVLKELRDSNKKDLESTLLNSVSISDIDLHLLSQLKGQIYTLNTILELRILNDYIQEEKSYDESSRT